MTDTQTAPTFDGWTDTSIGWVPNVGWRPSPENVRAAYEVLDHIDAHPGSWLQDVYWCGTGGCFAGWRAVLSGQTPIHIEWGGHHMADGESVANRAAQLLGFPDATALDDYTDFRRTQTGVDKFSAEQYGEAEYLFDGSNSRENLGDLVALIFGPRPPAS